MGEVRRMPHFIIFRITDVSASSAGLVSLPEPFEGGRQELGAGVAYAVAGILAEVILVGGARRGQAVTYLG